MASLHRKERESTMDHQRLRIQGDNNKNYFESLISCEINNPLPHWLRYITWSESNSESNEHESLMERCVKTCVQNSKEYCKNDVRFIQICVRYADKTSSPPDVYHYLHQQGIGESVALFWIAWAWVAETNGDFALCEKIYREGISKRASPLSLLQQRQRQFQRRLNRHITNASIQLPIQQIQDAKASNNKENLKLKQENKEIISNKEKLLFSSGDSISRKADGLTEKHEETKVLNRSLKTNSTINCGFDKSLISKDSEGQECCFEEHRAKRRCFKIFQSPNINFLACDEDHRMDTDESTVFSKELSPGRRVLFADHDADDRSQKSSFTNASALSSNVSRFAGISVSREEETINTKFAMKELSMMFSSPAMGLNESEVESIKRPRLNDSGMDVPLLEENESCLNNSIVDVESNRKQKKKFQVFTEESEPIQSSLLKDTKWKSMKANFEENPFNHDVVKARSLKDEECSRNNLPEISSKQNHLQIYFDENVQECNRKPHGIKRKPFQVFSEIIDDNDCNDSRNVVCNRFTDVVHSDGTSNGIQKLDEDESEESRDTSDNDTATYSIFGDAVNILNEIKDSNNMNQNTFQSKEKVQKPLVELSKADPKEKKSMKIYQDCDTSQDSELSSGEAGDTATFSVFGEAMDALNGMARPQRAPRPSSLSPCLTKDFSADDFRNFRPLDSGAILTDAAFGDISIIAPEVKMSPTINEVESFGGAVVQDYNSLHRDDVRISLRDMVNAARPIGDSNIPFAKPETDLVVTLSLKGSIVDLSNQALPRGLKRRTSIQGEEIKVGSRSGIVKQELGRGSYGVVVLLDSEREGVIAVKAQSPTDCLAWEYIIMKRLEDRCKVEFFPYPIPLSFISLSDGAMLGMTAGSKTGMNLVDILNIYKVTERGQVPELIALHYTSRMLKHIETLHWHGNILHCDVKPDNWVVVASDSAFEGCSDVIESAELMLVDFGRAVDLRRSLTNDVDPMKFKLSGEATSQDMACVAMRLNLPWSFDIDTFGICASAFVLLYGSHIEIERDRSKRWKIRKPLRRYWQKSIWSEVFDSLLNDPIASRPGSLRKMREKIESFLSTKKKDLEYLLKHQDRILPKKRLE